MFVRKLVYWLEVFVGCNVLEMSVFCMFRVGEGMLLSGMMLDWFILSWFRSCFKEYCGCVGKVVDECCFICFLFCVMGWCLSVCYEWLFKW